jgi:hypothetical protein
VYLSHSHFDTPTYRRAPKNILYGTTASRRGARLSELAWRYSSNSPPTSPGHEIPAIVAAQSVDSFPLSHQIPRIPRCPAPTNNVEGRRTGDRRWAQKPSGPSNSGLSGSPWWLMARPSLTSILCACSRSLASVALPAPTQLAPRFVTPFLIAFLGAHFLGCSPLYVGMQSHCSPFCGCWHCRALPGFSQSFDWVLVVPLRGSRSMWWVYGS